MMHLSKEFEVSRRREEVAAKLSDEALLDALFPDAATEVVARSGSRRTVESRYTALGREGVATFHFDYVDNGDVQFAKVCDGRVWRKLVGCVELEAAGDATRVRIELDGNTKALVPEIAIRGPMRDQLDQMTTALKRWLA
jgi:carbon monoxide dehydrogenase subunit G